ncbi:MAG TPA: hypothetical protein PKA20_09685 [Burkholderiaceae bacterium]|nr:hypothetical protein [Burkholderiaceae bacterium]
MANDLYVGTAGMSVWFSKDDGQTWARPYTESGLYLEARVWSMAASPIAPDRVYAGTDFGLQRWDPEASRWEHLPSPLDGLETWALEVSPHDPLVMLAGTHPAGLFRSEDGGRTWSERPCEFVDQCTFVGKPRITQIRFDPRDRNLVWAGVEVDGIRRSADGGRTWEKCPSKGLVSDDIHGLGIEYVGDQRKLFAATNKGIHHSTDDGDHWTLTPLRSEWQYTRVVVPRADHDGTIFLTNGDGPPGSTGKLLRSRDYGTTWSDAGLPGELNSTPWCIATHPADPRLLFVATNLGQLFRSRDGGETWVRLKREFGEIRSVMWLPAAGGATGFTDAFKQTLGLHEQKIFAAKA